MICLAIGADATSDCLVFNEQVYIYIERERKREKERKKTGVYKVISSCNL